jgi:hypothetical protein
VRVVRARRVLGDKFWGEQQAAVARAAAACIFGRDDCSQCPAGQGGSSRVRRAELGRWRRVERRYKFRPRARRKATPRIPYSLLTTLHREAVIRLLDNVASTAASERFS